VSGRQYPWERPLGARPTGDGRVQFRAWAPRARSLALRLEGRGDVELKPAGHGVYEVLARAQPGEDYWFVVDGRPLPDPCSRWQPAGLRGPSRVLALDPPPRLDPPTLEQLVIYELHVGTWTPEGTFAAAIGRLPELAELGVRAIELMPVAEYPGRHGWGYDGVYLSAAQSSYGGPLELRRLVDSAHERGVAVILDVVYNHVGASGVEALEAFGPYFTDQYKTPWGRAINFDDADSDAVRQWVIQNAVGWVRDFGVDGVRLDAIHAIRDSSAEHIVAAIAAAVHEAAPGALVIAESGLNDPRVIRGRERGGYGCDAAWADDFHHALRAILTGERDGYYVDFGAMAQLAKAWRRPYVHDGTYSIFRRRRFGAAAGDVPAQRFIVFSQNHDQVGNRAQGDRMPAEAQPLAAFCTLLAPFVPLLFMGEEYGERAPFQFFSDHVDKEIAEATREGRRREFEAFAEFGGEVPDPQAVATYERSKLTRTRDDGLTRLYAELLKARVQLPSGDVGAIDFDRRAKWLRVKRGSFELVMNFSRQRRSLRCEGCVQLATTQEIAVHEGRIDLAPLSGALIELPVGSGASPQ
jgi:maltooligosyltrehalose trehalohydrolase